MLSVHMPITTFALERSRAHNQFFIAVQMKHFTVDRFNKYGYGLVRLLLVTFLSFYSLSFPHVQHFVRYLMGIRWLGHAYIGTIGAIVNVDVVSFNVNLILLIGAGIICILDLQYDYSILIYLAKTFGGDFLAGKLDSTEWKLVLIFVFGIFCPLSFYLQGFDDIEFWFRYLRVFIVLFVIQLFCEYGDNHWEHLAFFRYRYSFEVLNLVLLLCGQLEEFELDVVRYDLFICFFYRLSNFVIILSQTDYLVNFGNMLIFNVYGWYSGTRVVQITDPDLATLVLKNSNDKGKGLEMFMSAPAWLPVLSLESIDGA